MKLYYINFQGSGIIKDHRTIFSQLNRDGRPSGFARVIFESEEAWGKRMLLPCCVGYPWESYKLGKSWDKLEENVPLQDLISEFPEAKTI